MSQSLALILVHLIFSTKNRISFLQSSQLRSEVHAYLTATLHALGSEPLQVGGVADHVHLLFGLSRTTSLADVVKNLSSTKVVKNKGHPDFSWQAGYGAFSVSQSMKDSVVGLYRQPGNASSQNDIPRRTKDDYSETRCPPR